MKLFYIMKKILIILLILITTIGVIINYKDYFLRSYADFFIINNAQKGSDLILILSGNILTRAPHAFQLIANGYSSRIMITNMMWHKLPFNIKYPSDIELARKIKKKYNLNKIILEILPSIRVNGATSTFDEAKDLKIFLSKNNLKNIIIVTDENHSRRALMAFQKILNENKSVKISVSAVSNKIYDKNNWWKSDLGLKTYILEPFLLVYYYFYKENLKFIKNY